MISQTYKNGIGTLKLSKMENKKAFLIHSSKNKTLKKICNRHFWNGCSFAIENVVNLLSVRYWGEGDIPYQILKLNQWLKVVNLAWFKIGISQRGSNGKFVTVSRQFSALADMIRRDGFERLLTSYFLTSLIFPSLLDYNLLELDGEAFLNNFCIIYEKG